MRYPLVVPVLALALATAMQSQAQADHPPLHVNPSLKSCSVQFAPSLTQAAYRQFVREFGSVSAFKQMSPASTLEKGRIAMGIEVLEFTEDEWSPAWNDTFYHPTAHHPLGSSQMVPKLKVRAGVADDMDVGAFFIKNPEANYGWLGIDGKYRLLTEGAGVPVNLAVRGAYTKTLYVSDMDMHAVTADVSVDRRMWRGMKPYVGVGADGVYARETSDSVSLRTERIVAPHVFGGIDVPIGRRMSLGTEFTLGARPSVQVQLSGIAF